MENSIGGVTDLRALYQPLSASAFQIRLIKVISNDSQQTTTAVGLHVFDLTAAPKYAALSYTWRDVADTVVTIADGHPKTVGRNVQTFLSRCFRALSSKHSLAVADPDQGEPTGTQTICINDYSKQVGNNLFAFLKRWGQRSRKHIDDLGFTEYIWIDQLSINQDNLEEKGSQVGRMGDIYARAKTTIIWLGDDPTRGTAVQALHKTRHNFMYRQGPIPSAAEQQTVLAILKNTYWGRHWIAQEIVLSTNRIVWYGLSVFYFRILQEMFDHMNNDWPDAWWAGFDLHDYPTLEYLVLLCRWRRNAEPVAVEDRLWSDAMSYAKVSKCHNPRDKIYGVQSLFPNALRLPIDYTLPVKAVYLEAVVHYHRTFMGTKAKWSEAPLRSKDLYEPCIKLAQAMGLTVKGDEQLKDLYHDWRHRNDDEIFSPVVEANVRMLYEPL